MRRADLPEARPCSSVANRGVTLLDQPCPIKVGKLANGPKLGALEGACGGSDGSLPLSQWPFAQSAPSDQISVRSGNSGKGRASQHHANIRSSAIIGTPAEDVSLLPGVVQYCQKACSAVSASVGSISGAVLAAFQIDQNGVPPEIEAGS